MRRYAHNLQVTRQLRNLVELFVSTSCLAFRFFLATYSYHPGIHSLFMRQVDTLLVALVEAVWTSRHVVLWDD